MKEKVKKIAKIKMTKFLIAILTSSTVLSILGFLLIFIVIVGSFFTFTQTQNRIETSESAGNVRCSGGQLSEEGIKLFEQNAKGGALEGKTKNMIKIAEQEKVPPDLFFAIVAWESGWGKEANATKQKNPLSVMGNATIYDTGYPTIELGLKDGARNLYDLYISMGLTTPKKIGPKYAPTVNASNDPEGSNNNWIPGVTKILESLQGSKLSCDEGEDYKGKIKEWNKKSGNGNFYTPGQCTWYVFAMRLQMGKPISTFWHDAHKWNDKAKSDGFKVGVKPKVGAVLVVEQNSSSPVYGHVALVTKVNKDGSFDVTEMNYKGPYIVSDRHIDKVSEIHSFVY